jgi:hypothetical protein
MLSKLAPASAAPRPSPVSSRMTIAAPAGDAAVEDFLDGF